MTILLTPDRIRGLKGRIALDVETTGSFNPHQGELVGLGIWAPDLGLCGYIPCPEDQSNRQEICDAVASWEPGTVLIGHNLKYELKWLSIHPDALSRWQVVDTMVAEHLLREEAEKDLGSLETRYFGTRSKKRLVAEGNEYGGIKKIRKWPLELQAMYCENDCRITYEVAQQQLPRIRDEGMVPLWKRQMRYLRALYRMEHRGARFDIARAEATIRKSEELMKIAIERLAEICDEHGVEPLKNWGSPQKLSKLLYTDLGLPKPECPPELKGTRKESAYSGTATGKELLAKLSHPIPDMVLKYRKVKTLSGYLSKYLLLMRVDPQDPGYGYIHANFNQAGTVTARLSSSNPNMQQVSGHAEGKELDPEGKGIMLRPHFLARPGYEFVSIDYKQMEVVMFALLCRDPKLLDMVRSGEDAHDFAAEMLFGKRGNPYRKWVKGINFGILYGMGIPAMAASLGVSIDEATRLYNLYLSTFARARPWMREAERQLETQGYVLYWSGRKRRIKHRNLFYQGVNSLVQGGCADILSEAIIRVDDYLQSRGLGEGLIAPVHDEILMELRSDGIEQTIEVCRELMSVPDIMGQAFNTDAEYAQRWGEVEEEGSAATTQAERERLMRKLEREQAAELLEGEDAEA